MALADRKITAYATSVSALADRPKISAAALKAVFDARSNGEIKSSLNGVIDDLLSGAAANEIAVDGQSLSSRLSQCGENIDTLLRENVQIDGRVAAIEQREYRKIAEITVDGESVPCTSAITVDRDGNGGAFSLTDITVLFEIPATPHANSMLYLRSGTRTMGQRSCVSETADRACVAEAHFVGVWRTFWSFDSTLHANAATLYASLAQNFDVLPERVTSITLALGTKNTGTAVFPVGTKIYIYGRCGL